MSFVSLAEKVEEIFLSSKKRVIGTLVVVILLLSIPVTLKLVSQQQDVRQRAASISANCPASTLQSFNANQQQSACNSGLTSYQVSFTCGDGFSTTRSYQCGFNNSGAYQPDGIAICAARSNLCAPTPLPSSPLPTPKQISCPAPVSPQTVRTAASGTVNITFDMKAPIYAVANGPMESVTYVSGNWCAWATGNQDPLSGGRCPLACPQVGNAGGGMRPITISADKLSFVSDFDFPYPDNSGSCTYTVTCTASAQPSPSESPPPNTSPSPNVSPVLSHTPTPTSAQPGATVALNVTLPGIGPNTALGENNKPILTSRKFTAYLFDSQGKQVGKTDATLAFNGSLYTGSAKFPGVPAGPYIVKVRSDNSLIKAIPGIIQLTLDTPAATTQIILVTGDINTSGDSDNILDLSDYNTLLSAYGSGSNSHTPVDLNDDGIIDAKDLNILLRGFATRKGD